jgi:hypothetical protein
MFDSIEGDAENSE